MKTDSLKKAYRIHSISRAIISIALVFVFLPSCQDDNKNTIKSFKNINSIPTMRTTNVSTLISDSGITRYRLVTKEWLVFDKINPPYSYFPKGIYVEKFDSAFRVEASIKADTAYFYDANKLWVLKKNVKVINFQGEKFETEELFWDQNLHKVYSNKFIRIVQTKRIITGLGFESNEMMTHYQINKTQGIFEINETNNNPASAPL